MISSKWHIDNLGEFMDYQSQRLTMNHLNLAIDALEDNQKVFADRLAELEKDDPNFYYQKERNKLFKAIADLKVIRDKIGSIDWV